PGPGDRARPGARHHRRATLRSRRLAHSPAAGEPRPRRACRARPVQGPQVARRAAGSDREHRGRAPELSLVELLHDYGPWVYVILFIIVFAETGFVITPFLPGDSLLFAAGALAAVDSS